MVFFYQLPYAHLRGQGCPKCGKLKLRKKFQLTKEKFVEISRQIHGDKYDYSKVEYINDHTKVEIICPKHGSFWQTPRCHFNSNGCPTCKGELSTSVQENEIYNYINSLTQTIIIKNDRQVISPLELDMYLPFENIAFEYNGLYWHQYSKVGCKYHLQKTELCEKQGIKLFHIFEDEWENKKEIVKAKIRGIFSLYDRTINANECTIRGLKLDEVKSFIENDSLQHYKECEYNFGLIYKNEIMSLMSFENSTINDNYELIFFCNKIGINVIDARKVLLFYFIQKFNPKEITIYLDRRWAEYDVYEKFGFKKIGETNPKCSYIINGKREASLIERKQINGTIYDCGQIIFNLKIQNSYEIDRLDG